MQFTVTNKLHTWCNDGRESFPDSPKLTEQELGPESHSNWPYSKHNTLKLFCAANLYSSATEGEHHQTHHKMFRNQGILQMAHIEILSMYENIYVHVYTVK